MAVIEGALVVCVDGDLALCVVEGDLQVVAVDGADGAGHAVA